MIWSILHGLAETSYIIQGASNVYVYTDNKSLSLLLRARNSTSAPQQRLIYWKICLLAKFQPNFPGANRPRQ